MSCFYVITITVITLSLLILICPITILEVCCKVKCHHMGTRGVRYVKHVTIFFGLINNLNFITICMHLASVYYH